MTDIFKGKKYGRSFCKLDLFKFLHISLNRLLVCNPFMFTLILSLCNYSMIACLNNLYIFIGFMFSNILLIQGAYSANEYNHFIFTSSILTCQIYLFKKKFCHPVNGH